MEHRLVGRSRELRDLTALLEPMAPGRRPIALIEGAPGSGKTRLLREIVAVARGRGVRVVHETGWIDGATVRRIVTESRRRTDGPGAGSGRGAPETVPVGLLVVCDDVGWIDPRMILTCDGLVRSAPLLVVLTRRTGVDWPGLDLLEPSRVLGVGLGPLPPAAVRDLAADLLGGRPGGDLVALAEAAAGNPGALVDLIVGLREEGLVVVERGRPVLRGVRLPARLRLRLRDQLQAMSPPARQLLRVASTFEPTFRLSDLTDLMGCGAATLLPAIDEVLASGVLVGEGERLRFGHDLVRAAVADSLPRSVLAALRDERARLGAARVAEGGGGNRIEDRAGALERGGGTDGWDRLSPQERQIAGLVGRALTNQQIATRIGRSPHTVNYHLRQIFKKLGLSSRVELASLVNRQRPLVSPHNASKP